MCNVFAYQTNVLVYLQKMIRKFAISCNTPAAHNVHLPYLAIHLLHTMYICHILQHTCCTQCTFVISCNTPAAHNVLLSYLATHLLHTMYICHILQHTCCTQCTFAISCNTPAAHNTLYCWPEGDQIILIHPAVRTSCSWQREMTASLVYLHSDDNLMTITERGRQTGYRD